MLLYAFLYAAAGPWSFCRLLHPIAQERTAHMGVLRGTWELFLRLRHSALVEHGQFLKALTFFSWMIWQEPMQLFERANWDPADPAGLSYVAAMFG